MIVSPSVICWWVRKGHWGSVLLTGFGCCVCSQKVASSNPRGVMVLLDPWAGPLTPNCSRGSPTLLSWKMYKSLTNSAWWINKYNVDVGRWCHPLPKVSSSPQFGAAWAPAGGGTYFDGSMTASARDYRRRFPTMPLEAAWSPPSPASEVWSITPGVQICELSLPPAPGSYVLLPVPHPPETCLFVSVCACVCLGAGVCVCLIYISLSLYFQGALICSLSAKDIYLFSCHMRFP